MKVGSQTIGHPVDVATGVMHNTFEDISIPGKVALEWNRFYSTALIKENSPLGPGWFNKYFCELTFKEDHYLFRGPDGSPIKIYDPENRIFQGETLRNFGAFTEIWLRDKEYTVCQWDVNTGEVWRYLFGKEEFGIGPLKEIQDPTGQGVELTYGLGNRLTTITQKLERRALLLHYNSRNLIENIEFQSADKKTSQNLFRYSFDSKGHLIAATDAADYPDHFEYDSNNRITREVKKDGAVFSFKYDRKGRCICTRGLESYDEKRLRFLDNARCTEVTDSLGHIRQFQWNADGQVFREINALNAEYMTGFDEYGRIISKTNPNGQTVTYEYDTCGNRSKTTNALNQTIEITYNHTHLPLLYKSAAGYSWERFYDQNNRLIRTQDPEGQCYFFQYDERGNLIEMRDPLGYRLCQRFTDQGILQSSTDWNGNVTCYCGDSFGRLKEFVDPLKNCTKYKFDLVGNLIRIDHPDGTDNQYGYDQAGNLRFSINRDGHMTRYKFGPCKRLTEIIDPLGRKTTLSWGREPKFLESISNSKGENYRFEYNAVGWVVREIDFDGRELSFEYDMAGNRVSTINGIGEKIEYKRDPLGRLVSQKLPDNQEATFSYDEAGFLVQAINANSNIKFDRDKLGRIISEIQNGHVIDRNYDSNGNLQQLKSDLGVQMDYQFDANGLLNKLRVGEHNSLILERDARGSVTRQIIPGQKMLTQEYDSMGRLITQNIFHEALSSFSGFKSPKPFIHRNYRYQDSHLVEVCDQSWGQTTYVYDPVERLTQVLRENGGSENYLYDDSDNLIQIGMGNDSTPLSYGVGNQLKKQNNVEFQYDFHGRLIQKAEKLPNGKVINWKYEWDALDQLKKLTNSEGKTWCYKYDPFGRRIEKKSSDGWKEGFIWDNDVVLHEIKNGSVTSSWVFDPHSYSPLCKVEAGNFYSVINDHLGTPRELVDGLGRIIWKTEYYSWGLVKQQKKGEVDCPVRFQGQWRDEESGLHYNWFRYYDPQTGRYICKDPIGLRGGDNLYLYTKNPIHWVDPFGLNAEDPKPADYRSPLTVEPGTTRRVEVQKISERTGQPYTHVAHYDEQGRMTGQTHYGDHGRKDHGNPHHHRRDPVTGQKLKNPATGTRVWPGVHPDEEEHQRRQNQEGSSCDSS